MANLSGDPGVDFSSPSAAAESGHEAAAAPPPMIKIVVDGVNLRGEITGWACVPAAPSRRVSIGVLADGDLVSSGLASLPRPDVGEAGFGDGNSGFALPLPERLLDGATHAFALVAEAPEAAPLTTEIALELPRPPPGGATRLTRPQAEPPVATVPLLLSAGGGGGMAAIYVPGYRIVCMQPHPRPVYHVRGWHVPEEEFTWIDGTEAVIEMLIRRPREQYRLTLDVVPNGASDRLQTLQIFFNHFCVGWFEVPAPARLTVDLPAELFILRRSQLLLHCERAVSGAELGVTDTRRLGIAVCGWCIG
jgi:hypothetical protein